MSAIPDKFDWDKWHKQALENSKMEGQIFRLIPVLSFEQVQSYIAELEYQLEDWINNGWAEDYKARIAELEGFIDRLIEVGDELADDREYQDDLVDLWHDVTRGLKEREE